MLKLVLSLSSRRSSGDSNSGRSPAAKKPRLSSPKGDVEFILTPSLRSSDPLDLSSPVSTRSRLSKEVDKVLNDSQLLVDVQYDPSAQSSYSNQVGICSYIHFENLNECYSIFCLGKYVNGMVDYS